LVELFHVLAQRADHVSSPNPAPLVVARQLRGAAGWEPAARWSVAHGLTALGLGFATPLCLAWRGILQRALLLATFSWLAGMAACVLRQTS
jgi:hypothetical protein